MIERLWYDKIGSKLCQHIDTKPLNKNKRFENYITQVRATSL